MKILGLHKDPWHNTGACAIKGDDERFDIAFVSEERLDRIKDSRAFPLGAIKACMDQLDIASIGDFDMIVMDYINESSDWRIDQFKQPCSTENVLRTVEQDKIHIVDHHLCHAYAAFTTSPFEEAAILVIDGRGSDRKTQSLYIGRGSQVELIADTAEIGIGLLYAAMTQHIGFGLLQEGKTMGLAPLGREKTPANYEFKGRFNGIETDYSSFCEDGGYEIIGEYKKPKTFDAKARAAYETQFECERAMLHLAQYAKEVTRTKYLCITGGVALNSVANNAILKSGIFEDIFINPAASDTGIPLGAALYGYYGLNKNKRRPAEISPYLGPSYSKTRVSEAIASFSGYEVIKDDAMGHAVRLLADNQIVARFEGRSEMGPRALGHRSILMSPLRQENKDQLNARVKFREEFRPFAPLVLEEYASEYFDLDRPSKYMLLVPDVMQEKRKIIPAVTHVDGTARVQTVTKEFNGDLYDLLHCFYEETNVPVILNTSYNVANEPIVETPEDAIKCFLGTNIDALYIEDFILIKN